MYFFKYIRLLYLLLFCGFSAAAQLLPADNSTINYRLVDFRFPMKKTTVNTVFELAVGHHTTVESFRKHIVKTASPRTGSVTVVLPKWGVEYTWMLHGNTAAMPQDFHYVKTGKVSELDTALFRIRVIIQAQKFKDGYFFVDGTRLMYNMNGDPVWYLPDLPGVEPANYIHLRDMKITPQGTLTFLLLEDAFEVDYNGKILWQAPHEGSVSGDSVEHVHHEFNRLRNGHYMLLGKKYDKWYLPQTLDTAQYSYAYLRWDSVRKTAYQQFEFGTIIEYDTAGHVVWSWGTKDYFMKTPLRPGVQKKMELLDAHSNSLYFNEADSTLYLGFRNLSSILHISYPSGKVLNQYRNTSGPGGMMQNDALFCYQHSCSLTSDRRISLFNNNLCRIGALPEIVVLEQPKDGIGGLKKLWDFPCPIPVDPTKPPLQFVAGGNAVELPDHSFFASLYGDFCARVFIVGTDKKLSWCVSPEMRNAVTKEWEGFDFYRASIITDQGLLKKFINF